jgi:hypothetical protein
VFRRPSPGEAAKAMFGLALDLIVGLLDFSVLSKYCRS